MSADLEIKIELALDELDTVVMQVRPLVQRHTESEMGDMETAAACAMLHSFYTEIEKILK